MWNLVWGLLCLVSCPFFIHRLIVWTIESDFQNHMPWLLITIFFLKARGFSAEWRRCGKKYLIPDILCLVLNIMVLLLPITSPFSTLIGQFDERETKLQVHASDVFFNGPKRWGLVNVDEGKYIRWPKSASSIISDQAMLQDALTHDEIDKLIKYTYIKIAMSENVDM